MSDCADAAASHATADQEPFWRAHTRCERLQDGGALEAARHQIYHISSEHGHAIAQLQYKAATCRMSKGKYGLKLSASFCCTCIELQVCVNRCAF